MNIGFGSGNSKEILPCVYSFYYLYLLNYIATIDRLLRRTSFIVR
jgi:hypothetical protein